MPTPTTASPTVRRALRGSAIGMSLLVSAAVAAPPALATPTPGIDGLLVPGPLGVGPLTGVTPLPEVPSATGAEQIQPLTPDFGVGKNLDVHLTAATVPADLDLSGARFEVVDAAGTTQAACTTDAHGVCDIQVAHFDPTVMGFPQVNDIAPGAYRLRQDPAHAVPGLVPSTVAIPFTVCSPFVAGTQCQSSVSGGVADASLFRTGLAVTVRDGATHSPLAGASFSLTGADYRHIDPSVRQDQVTTLPAGSGNQSTSSTSAAPTTSVTPDPGSAASDAAASDTAASDTAASDTAASDTAANSAAAAEVPRQLAAAATAGPAAAGPATGPVTSGSDGLLTYRGWFLDGAWELTPEVIPSGYRSSGVFPLTLPVRSGASGDTWATVVDLAPEDGAVMGTGGSPVPVPSVAPRAPVPSAVPPVSAVPTAPRPAAATGRPVPAAPPSVADAPPASAPETSPVPETAGLTPADPSAAPVPAAEPIARSPRLRATASTSLLDVGLISFGVLFVALVVFGVGVLRRRARG